MSDFNTTNLEHLTNTLDMLPNPVTLNKKVFNEDGSTYDKIVFINRAFKEIIGYTKEDIPTDQHWFSLAYPDRNYQQFIIEEWTRALEKSKISGNKFIGFPAKVNCKDSVERWFQVTTQINHPIFDEYHTIIFVEIQTPDNTILELQSVTQDIQKKNLEITKTKDALDIQYNLLTDILNTVPVRIFWKDLKGTYLGANKLFLEDTQLGSIDNLVGKNDFELPWGETEAQSYRDDDIEVMKNGKPRLKFEEVQTNSNGDSIFLLTSKVPLKSKSGSITGVLGTYEDITQQRTIENELKQQKNILNYQAHHDILTNLPNRILFNDRLGQAIEKAKRNNTIVALFFLDLDQFKQINDSLGHEIGDEVLKDVASLLKSTIRSEDSLARFGGDEFAIIMEDLVHAHDVSSLAQKIINVLFKPINVDEHVLYVSSSIGISLYPQDGSDIQSLLKYADAAMYKAKDEGRNNYQFYSSEMTEMAFERVAMEASLRQAIEKNQFVVYYQAQTNGTTDELIGMEALVRWQHPYLGLVQPSKFIPLAEETGLIIQIDQLVMQMAMEQIVKWYNQGLNPGRLALNLAMKQLQKDDFVFTIENMINRFEVKPEWLELEVTEGQIMNNPENAIKRLNQISDLGIELAIDDFGTGYSSLSYLKKLPINKLKIDQSFVRDLPYDEEDIGITKAVIAISKSLNLKVIAEGVETKEQKDFLVENGCENIQGYFYGKAISAKEMEDNLKKV